MCDADMRRSFMQQLKANLYEKREWQENPDQTIFVPKTDHNGAEALGTGTTIYVRSMLYHLLLNTLPLT